MELLEGAKRARERHTIRLSSLLFLDSFFSSFAASPLLVPFSDTSLAERGNPTSLPLRLPFEPLAIESRLGLGAGSGLLDDVEGAVI